MALVAEFVVPGVPVPWSRPRLNGRAGAHGKRFHTAEKDSKHRRNVALCSVAGALRPDVILDEPVLLRVLYVLPIPTKTTAKRREEMHRGVVRPTGTPDLDNLVKSTKDAIKGLLLRDDALVVEVQASKWYGDEPRTEVQLYTVTDRGAPPAQEVTDPRGRAAKRSSAPVVERLEDDPRQQVLFDAARAR